MQSEDNTDALRNVHHQPKVRAVNPLEATGLMVGISIGTGVLRPGRRSFEVGTAVSPENRATDKRRINPYASVGVGTAFGRRLRAVHRTRAARAQLRLQRALLRSASQTSSTASASPPSSPTSPRSR